MPDNKFGLVCKDDYYDGIYVRVVNASGKVKTMPITNYPQDPPPYFVVEVQRKLYACVIDDKNDRILIAPDKHMEYKWQDRVYGIIQNYGSSMLALILRNTSPVASVQLDAAGAWLVFTGGEEPRKKIKNYPQNPTNFFALCIEDGIYVFLAKDTGHVVIEVPSTPMKFMYGGSTYVVTCDGLTPVLERTT